MKLFSLMRDFWMRLMPFRFLVVGGWNFVFGYLAFAGFYWLFNDCWPDWVIVVVSSVFGITNSFVFHRWLTYQSKGVWWKEYFRFYIVYGGQLLLNVALISVFVTWLKWNAYAVQLAVNVVLTIASYWAHKSYSFNGA